MSRVSQDRATMNEIARQTAQGNSQLLLSQNELLAKQNALLMQQNELLMRSLEKHTGPTKPKRDR